MTFYQLKRKITRSNMDRQTKLELFRNLNVLQETYSSKNGHSVLVEMNMKQYKIYMGVEK